MQHENRSKRPASANAVSVNVARAEDVGTVLGEIHNAVERARGKNVVVQVVVNTPPMPPQDPPPAPPAPPAPPEQPAAPVQPERRNARK